MRIPTRTSLQTKRLIGILNQLPVKPKSGVEIGVQWGQNAKGLLGAFPQLRLLLVDNYEERHNRWENRTAEYIRRYAEHNLKQFADRIEWMVMPSVAAAELIPDRSLDYGLVDASHDYASVRDDIRAWLPKIRDGGILAGHDLSERFPGVRKAVTEKFADGWSRMGNVWWVNVNGGDR